VTRRPLNSARRLADIRPFASGAMVAMISRHMVRMMAATQQYHGRESLPLSEKSLGTLSEDYLSKDHS
jgi:hypothetical protein